MSPTKFHESCIHHDMRGKCTADESGGDVDHLLARLAERQHGLVARRQLLSMGISRRAIDVRVASGQLHRTHQGVYSVGHPLLETTGRWMAAVLAYGPGAVLSHRSAGQLWQLVPGSAAMPEVTRARPFRTRAGIRAHHSQVPDDEVTSIDGIPVTSVSRTLLDLASVLTRSQLERALNEAEVRGLTDRFSVPDLLERYPRRAGSAVLRALFRDRAAVRGITRSELERRFMAVLDGSDLPHPRRNAHVSVRGRFFEVDCLWAEQRVIVELDGWESHGTDLAFEKDRERDRLLLVDGWRITRVTWRHLRDDATGVMADLSELLRE